MCSIINKSYCFEEKECGIVQIENKETGQRYRSWEASLRSEDGVVLARGEHAWRRAPSIRACGWKEYSLIQELTAGECERRSKGKEKSGVPCVM